MNWKKVVPFIVAIVCLCIMVSIAMIGMHVWQTNWRVNPETYQSYPLNPNHPLNFITLPIFGWAFLISTGVFFGNLYFVISAFTAKPNYQ